MQADHFASRIERRPTRTIRLGNLVIGGDAPISVQTMTKTDTRDVDATVSQLHEVSNAGCDIVRLAVVDMDAAGAMAEIARQSPVPLVADIHFDHKLALRCIESDVSGLVY